VISVVTPSLNQGRFIRKNIESVLDQDVVAEHIVIDGGSTDETLSILAEYPHLKWVSEPDSGQSEAINKGLRMATGDILVWLNSDDMHMPQTYGLVQVLLEESDVIAGNCYAIQMDGSWKLHRARFTCLADLMSKHYHVHQPAVFLKRKVYEEVGDLREDLHLIMDFDYWVRVILAGFRVTTVKHALAAVHRHPDAKTGVSYAQYNRERMSYIKEL